MIALALKATLVLAAAFLAAACLRRGPAAVRHFVWTAALAATLALPFASLAPRPAAVQVAVAEPAIVVSATTAAAAPAPAIPWFAILYLTGAALAATRFLTGALRIARAARRAAPSTLGDEFGVRAVLSSEIPVPLAWGILRPVVVLPAGAASWPASRLRSVLLHEAMHHRRHDLLAQAVAQLACCLYWWNPLAWLALARQRAERERACDDAVLRHGIPAHDYASHLVDVVRASTARTRWSDAPAMADSSTLETRVRGVLDPAADRRPLTVRAAIAVAAAALLLVAPLTVVTLRAQSGTSISGVVEDPSGARVPNCNVTAKNIDGTNVEATTADMTGEYRFANIPSGRYELTFASPGFKPAKIDVTLVTGAALRSDARLSLGEVNETVKIVGSRPAPPAQAAPRTAMPTRIRIGGNVQALRLIRQPRPVYPPELQQARVEGTVVLRGVVSKTGTVLQPRVISTTDPRLNQAALDAVAQWLYQPTLLNGEPVETLTTISVDFQLGQ